jgi:hypothetical protein
MCICNMIVPFHHVSFCSTKFTCLHYHKYCNNPLSIVLTNTKTMALTPIPKPTLCAEFVDSPELEPSEPAVAPPLDAPLLSPLPPPPGKLLGPLPLFVVEVGGKMLLLPLRVIGSLPVFPPGLPGSPLPSGGLDVGVGVSGADVEQGPSSSTQ